MNNLLNDLTIIFILITLGCLIFESTEKNKRITKLENTIELITTEVK